MRIVLTFSGRDTPGIVHHLADVVAAHGGSWQDSRMARLAGHFAGILDVLVPDSQAPALRQALDALSADGIRVSVDVGDTTVPPKARQVRLECTAMDRPGIVQALTEIIISHHINVLELSTSSIETPMAGGFLFRATAHLAVPDKLDTSALHRDLQAVANDLLVELHEDHS